MTTMTPEYQRDRRADIKAAASLAAAPKDFSLGSMPGIRSFQREWLAAAFAEDIDLAALSAARGCGKSTLAGWIAACAIAPEGALHEPAGAVLIVAPTTSQGPRGTAGRAWVPGRCTRFKVARFVCRGRRPSFADGF